MIDRLHRFIHTGIPAFHDLESASTIEMIEKLYSKNNEIIDAYNKFESNIEKLIETYKTGTDKDLELFKVAMRQEFQDFIDIVNLKVMKQDAVISDAVDHMKNNLDAAVSQVVDEMVSNGEIKIGVTYNASTEELSISVS